MAWLQITGAALVNLSSIACNVKNLQDLTFFLRLPCAFLATMLRTETGHANLFACPESQIFLWLPDYGVGCVEEWSSGLRHLAITQAYGLANRTAGSKSCLFRQTLWSG